MISITFPSGRTAEITFQREPSCEVCGKVGALLCKRCKQEREGGR